MNYILMIFLTFNTTGVFKSASAPVRVDHYITEARCIEVGNEWVKKFNDSGQNNMGLITPGFTCLSRN